MACEFRSRPTLGDVEVLTEGAGRIASPTPDSQSHCTGGKMKEWLLLDVIIVDRRHIAIDQALYRAVNVDSSAAYSRFILMNQTSMGTCEASYCIPIFLLKGSFVHYLWIKSVYLNLSQIDLPLYNMDRADYSGCHIRSIHSHLR
jgi:hypothetical protein